MVSIIKRLIPGKLKVKFKSFVNFLFPKNKKQIIFFSNPDFSDNSKTLFEELLKNNQQYHLKYKLIWIVENPNLYKSIVNHTKFVKHKSLKSYICFMRSKYLFTTEGIYNFSVKRQVFFQLWHGNGLKKIEKVFQNSNDIKADYVSVSSDFFKEKWILGVKNPDNIISTGLPRNDELFKSVDLNKALNLECKYKKIVLWMPTFRNSLTGSVDGISNDFAVPLLTNDNLISLNEILIRFDMLLVIKMHKAALVKKVLPPLSNIKMISSENFNMNFSLYNLLGNIDALLTDYSSVYVDFLIVDKPIGFVYDDFKEYDKSRGFIVDNPHDFMPGAHLENYKALIAFLESIANNTDDHKEARKIVNSILNKYSDNQNARRVLISIGLLKDN